MRRLQERGATPADVGRESWDEEVGLGAALALLASTRAWDVLGTFDGLVAMSRLHADLEPVRRLFRQMQDLRAAALPARFGPARGGIVGIALPKTIAAALDAVEPFVTVDARELLGDDPEASLPQQVLTFRTRRRVRRDERLWQAWTELPAILRYTRDRGEWLGLHLV